MGDTGSSTLGFFMAAFSLWASVDNIFPVWVALLIFSPFIVDASVTLVRRMLAGEKIWEAHRSHYYQRLVQAGWGHRKTVLHAYLLMALCGGLSWLAMQVSSMFQWIIVLCWAAVYFMMIVGIRKQERLHLLEG